MVKRDGAFTRMERIRDMRISLQPLKNPLNLRKFLAVQMLKFGLTKPRVTEYLQVIEDLGEIEIDRAANLIRPVGDLNGEQEESV